MPRFFLTLLIFLVSSVEARMYQWTEPGTGTTQLSGKPPAWYRSANGGPRVFVFDNGRLIDDTGVEVSEEVRQRMRQQAFVMAEEDRQKAKEKIVKAKQLKQKYQTNEPKQTEQIEEEDLAGLEIDTTGFDNTAKEPETSDQEQQNTLDELKSLIEDWEKSQSENARRAIEQ